MKVERASRPFEPDTLCSDTSAIKPAMPAAARALLGSFPPFLPSSPMPPPPRTLLDIREAIAHRRASAEEITADALRRADRLNPGLNAFLEIFHERAPEQARGIDRRLSAGEPVGPLAGVPVALKDNLCLGPDWGKTTCASRMLADYRSPYTATAVQRLIDAGAVILGKTNLDEFAMGSSGEHSAFGPTRNPWDLERVPGGSSAGSCAAVSAGIVPLALGSDTGGSIRQPAGFCNLVGMKPTYGRISRYGLVAFASSLDQIGPITHTVADSAAALATLCGLDPSDSTSADLPFPDLADLATPLEDLVIGVPLQARSSANHPSVNAALENAARTFATLGADVVDIDLPHSGHGVAAYYIIAPAEASSNLARFDGIRYGRRSPIGPDETLADLYSKSRAEGFGAEVQRRIMLGTHVLSSGYYDAYYTTALKVRRLIKRDFDAAFRAGCHAVLMPSSPSPAFKIGEKTSDPLALYIEDVYTVGANLAGLPAITLPGGFWNQPSGAPLPVGIQVMGQSFGEHELLRIAHMFEQATNFWQASPPIPS